MITGVVNPRREATLRLSVRNANGQEREVEVILDTGFSGSMTLPSSVIAALGLPFRSRGRAILADGSKTEFDIHAATLVWDGALRNILVEAADTDPLIGMGLLYGHDIHIQAVDGGPVTIQQLTR
jgi:clan AA aspartic protease